MDLRECIDASCAVDRFYSSHYLKACRPSARSSTSLAFEWRFYVLPSIIILAFVVIQNAGLATAGIMLPVLRSFSQLEGSGTEEGSYGMTAGHARELRNHDYHRSVRNRRELTTVADFPLAGNEYYYGLYYTKIGLGTPSADYYVQVDTGSDLLWVNCKPCRDCPSKSDINIPLRLYDPAASPTSKNTSCSSNTCMTVGTIADSPCVDNSCYYAFSYGDGSTAMGYLVEDTLTYDTVVTNNTLLNASATVVFGCGFNQSGDSLTSEYRAVDGIIGFGRQVLSVVTQLADSGTTTSAFAHCLQGDTGQGGIFVIGDVQEPGLVYTKMVANQYHYNVVLLSISVGGTELSISSSVFDVTHGKGGTIFDSGTTMAFLVEAAYDAFVNQLTAVVSIQAVTTPDAPDTPCFNYLSTNSDLSSVFPAVTLNFDGGASMQLVPTNYLYKMKMDSTSSLWCLGWSASPSGLNGLTILGDIVLKNKLVVYDLGNEHIGWVDFDCLSSVKVSNGTGNQVLEPQQDNIPSGSLHSIQAYHPLALLICSVVLAYAVPFL